MNSVDQTAQDTLMTGSVAMMERGPRATGHATDLCTLSACERSNANVVYKIASTQEDRLEAFRVLYRQYSISGLIPRNDWRYYVTPYHASCNTTVIVGVQAHRVICTVSLVGDGELGLPMEQIYAREVGRRRRRGLYLSEVSCLAIRNVTRRGCLNLLIGMTRLMAQHARYRGIDQLLIAAHPKHARFYERYMGFRRFGDLRAYPKVQNRPAVASCLDFKTIDRDRPVCWDRYFGVAISERQLESPRLGRFEQSLYEQLAELTYGRPGAVSYG